MVLSHVKSPYSIPNVWRSKRLDVPCIWEAQSLESLARTWQNDFKAALPHFVFGTYGMWGVMYLYINK